MVETRSRKFLLDEHITLIHSESARAATKISQFRASDAGMAGEFLATHNRCSWCNRATYCLPSIVAPFDAMLLALIEDCIRSDASANLCKTVAESLGHKASKVCPRTGVASIPNPR